MANNERIQLRRLEISASFSLEERPAAPVIYGEYNPRPGRTKKSTAPFVVLDLPDASIVLISHN
jgi:hypothetical protein